MTGSGRTVQETTGEAKKVKKALTILLTLILTFSISLGLAGSGAPLNAGVPGNIHLDDAGTTECGSWAAVIDATPSSWRPR